MIERIIHSRPRSLCVSGLWSIDINWLIDSEIENEVSNGRRLNAFSLVSLQRCFLDRETMCPEVVGTGVCRQNHQHEKVNIPRLVVLLLKASVGQATHFRVSGYEPVQLN